MEFFYKNKDEFMKYEIEAAERIKKNMIKKLLKLVIIISMTLKQMTLLNMK